VVSSILAGKPKPVLTREPAGEIFEGDTVTLSCVVEGGSDGWSYLWYKDSQRTSAPQTDSSSGTGAGYTISAAALSHSGEYWCRARRGSKPFNSQYSNAVNIQVSKRPQAVLTQEPAWTQIYESERITLRCQVPGDYTDWSFTWYKDGRNAPVTQDSYSSIDGDSYTISSDAQYHSGEYTCKGVRTGNPSYSTISNSLTLRVSAGKPKPVLTRKPAGEIFEEDKITLSCVVEGGSDGWRYLWYKDSQHSTSVYQTDSSSGTGAGYTISAAALSHSGEYWCRAERRSNPFNSDYSNAVNIQVTERFSTPTLTVMPRASVWEGEAVTLQCGVQIYKQGTQLQYRYIKDNGDLSGAGSRDQYSIPAAGLRDTGSYQCEVEAAGTGLKKRSDSVRLSVRAGKPKPVLTREPAGEIFEEDKITLSCVVEGGSDGWRYLWYKDSQGTSAPQTDSSSKTGAGYTISAAALSHSGEYWCRAGRGSKPFNSQYSNAVNIQVSKQPQAVLTQEPAWTQIYKSESVTLRCQVPGDYTEWRFTWYKAGRNAPVTQDYYGSIDGDSYTISSATRDHSGEYTCKGVRTGNPSYSTISNSLTLRVSAGRPKPVLTQEPAGEIFEGDTVTLSCVVEGGSDGWRYLWYKDSQRTSAPQTDSSSGTGAGYTISAAALSHSGEYWCGAGRGRNTFYSEYSPGVKIQVSEVRPKAVLTLHPAWTQIFPADTVTLRCEVEGGSAGWGFKQYRDGREEAGCSDQYSRRYGDSCTISTAQYNHSGVYWCESASGQERSNAVNLTVSNQWVILQTPLQPVIEGDSLTLRCRVRTNYTFTRIVFFKDNEEIQSQNNKELSVDRVSKSDEGSYKCRAMWISSTYSGDSAEVQVSVRELFSRVTLTASPGATVKEGEALNLTCEAAVNKTPRPQLHYTIVRDGEPVTNSTDSALYSIASTEKSHTGSYTCAVESQGVKRSSQELHIEVETSWHSAVAIGYRVSFTLIHFIVFTLLLLQYCRIQGSLCIAGGTSRKTSDQDQEQSAERIELCSRVQHTGVELQ
ncbi:Fc receptor-like protein 5, partial [Acipenser ruthenus]|uniref:Fc receptor-like protein 5 n=1 Tax=Acipenser ruthenus TaxID=7906 RepID=UPI00274088A6